MQNIVKTMVKRLTLLAVILSLAAGVLAGAPLHAPKDGMMECCKRAKSKEVSPKAEAARLCCAINCTTTSPVSVGTSFNPAPAGFTITRSMADQIAALFPAGTNGAIKPATYSRESITRTIQPSYIQFHAFLI
ncbi:MAG: hypothetical protein ABJA02_00700 [Acidobacteriota bacterium]